MEQDPTRVITVDTSSQETGVVEDQVVDRLLDISSEILLENDVRAKLLELGVTFQEAIARSRDIATLDLSKNSNGMLIFSISFLAMSEGKRVLVSNYVTVLPSSRQRRLVCINYPKDTDYMSLIWVPEEEIGRSGEEGKRIILAETDTEVGEP